MKNENLKLVKIAKNTFKINYESNFNWAELNAPIHECTDIDIDRVKDIILTAKGINNGFYHDNYLNCFLISHFVMKQIEEQEQNNMDTDKI